VQYVLNNTVITSGGDLFVLLPADLFPHTDKIPGVL
jgi:hypothetical protein